MAEANPKTQVTLKNLRLSFADLFKPSKPMKNDKGEMVPGKFKCNGLMYKSGIFKADTDNNLKLIRGAKEAALTIKYGTDQSKWPKYKPEKLCVRDGNLEEYDGYADAWYISASEAEQPLLLSRRRDPDNPKIWMPATPTELYSGCYVNMIVNIWIQDSVDYGKRVNANLKAVQFLRKGDAFAGSTPISNQDAFTDVEEEEDGGDIGDDNFTSPDDDDDDVI